MKICLKIQSSLCTKNNLSIAHFKLPHLKVLVNLQGNYMS